MKDPPALKDILQYCKWKYIFYFYCFSTNESLASRIEEFVTREVNAIRSIQRSYGNNVQYVEDEAINCVMGGIVKFDIEGLKLLLLVQRFFGQYSSHFCHELYNYASCPTTTLMQYDLNVAYTVQSTFMDRSRNRQEMNSTIHVNKTKFYAFFYIVFNICVYI